MIRINKSRGDKEMFTTDGLILVDARRLYEEVGGKKDFSTWFSRQKNSANLAENVDFIVFSPSQNNGFFPKKIGKGRPRTEYLLTMEAANTISKGNITLRAYMKSDELRQRIKLLLEEWSTLEKRTNNLGEAIDELEEEMVDVPSIEAVTNEEHIPSGKITDPTHSKVAKLEALGRRLDMYIEERNTLWESYEWLESLVRKLPYVDQQIILLYYQEDLTWIDVGKKLDFTPKYCQKSARRLLKSCFT